MNGQFIQAAKALIPQIVKQSASLQNDEVLILDANGLQKFTELRVWIDDLGNVCQPADFIYLGSKQLTRGQVKNIIEQEEVNFYT
jgi:hypothetical protein